MLHGSCQVPDICPTPHNAYCTDKLHDTITYFSDGLRCSLDEFRAGPIHPEHTPCEVGMELADEVNHRFLWLEPVRPLQELCTDNTLNYWQKFNYQVQTKFKSLADATHFA